MDLNIMSPGTGVGPPPPSSEQGNNSNSSSSNSSSKRNKKHKRDYNREQQQQQGTTPTPAIRLILKVGSSTPEEDLQQQQMIASSSSSATTTTAATIDEDYPGGGGGSSNNKKRKKEKKKKNKENKRHKHHHKEKKQRHHHHHHHQQKEEAIEQQNNREIIIKEEEEQEATTEEIEIAPPPPPPPTKSEETATVTTTKKFIDKAPFLKLLDYLLKSLEKRDPSAFFAWPVTDKIAPGYSSIIREPMDFSSMRFKIRDQLYEKLSEFISDFKLICSNAMTYNAPETIYYKAAKKLLQSGLKLISPEKIRQLIPMFPSIRLLSEEQIGRGVLGNDVNDEVNDDDSEMMMDFVCLDPTKSVHYVKPHPNDPIDPHCGAFTDDLTTEEVLLQARLAAKEAAHRLATKKPNAKMGFLRQKQDGSTSLSILVPTTGVLPGTKELPISLGALSGKLTSGSAQIARGALGEEKKSNAVRGAKPLSYSSSSFSSFAPSHDSTFATLTNEERELMGATYGEETAVQYAESMITFARGCDYAMHMVDEILDTITKGEHRKTSNYLEERRKLREEELRMKSAASELERELEGEWNVSGGGGGGVTATTGVVPAAPVVDVDALKSLSDVGIDVGFLEEFTTSSNPQQQKLSETASLIANLELMQQARLASAPTSHLLPSGASDEELNLAGQITDNLTQMAKGVGPGDLIGGAEVRGLMGIDIRSNNKGS